MKKNLPIFIIISLMIMSAFLCGCGTPATNETNNAAMAEQQTSLKSTSQPVFDLATPTPDLTESWTMEQKNAYKSAQSYLKFSAFSREGLIHQLSSEYGDGYPEDVAEFVVEQLGIDWNEQAVKSAESYLKYSAFSKEGLKEQLTSEYGEQFTEDEADYAVNNIDVDWKEQAVKSAESYLKYSAFSRQGLYDQLTSQYGEQFTSEEAEYAVQQVYGD